MRVIPVRIEQRAYRFPAGTSAPARMASLGKTVKQVSQTGQYMYIVSSTHTENTFNQLLLCSTDIIHMVKQMTSVGCIISLYNILPIDHSTN